MAGRLAGARAGRRGALLALVVAVTAVHGCVASAVAERMADFSAAQSMPPRMDVAYVRELAPADPPAAPPPPAPVPAAAPRPMSPPAAVAAPVAAAASAAPAEAVVESTALAAPPPEAASAPESPPVVNDAVAATPPADEPAPAPAPVSASASDAVPPAAPAIGVGDAVASVPAAPAGAASAPLAAASAPTPDEAAATADAAALAGFDWPVSTRLSFTLTGSFRGEVHGTAQVEWIRKGAKYQVHLDTTIGPAIAPLDTRRMSSNGDITPAGLAPRRFDQFSKTIFRNPQQQTLLIDGDTVILTNGERRERPQGVQDMTSQFVQLSFLFGKQPELLRAGARIDMPLARPRNVDRWVYEVRGNETLSTPIGEFATVHLVPRREAGPAAGDLIMETWYAPSLRYLPVRIRIQQDADNFVDLLISKKPEIAAP